MKRILTAIVIIAAVFISTQNVIAEGRAEYENRGITVRGIGEISAAPDVVRLTLGVQSMNADLNVAINDNNSRIDRIINVIQDYGIPESAYRTSNFSVYYQQPYNNGMTPDNGTYNVNNSIFVELSNIELIGGFIEDALNAGANQFYGLEYAISNPEPLMKEARRLAIENALELAGETAGYAGLSIGNIISMEEQAYGSGPMYAAEMSAARGANSIVAPNQKTIQVQVTIRLELE
ncbi:MAG: SIMPL domain-containing protein [Spirochaetales bacterium]|uniref:SIMPL domain-containing protein n=1 Tax=Candidatus Thalassospirochaeta sargassi TaxID=3119039 RepID=A0AAJ1IH33_9SPIO|nr:SIMPL domain-containing protein [Spirochaetales bacterium]